MGGKILYTFNGGNTWITQKTVGGFFLEKVVFYGELNGWIVGHSGVTLQTSNGGNL